VYKLRKALYGLKHAPRAWYGRLRGFLFSKGFEMGNIDKTLFLLRQGDDILIVQVYADDIVFGGSSHSLVVTFAEDMSKEFEMSMMGELQFSLGLQIKQVKEETFVHEGLHIGRLCLASDQEGEVQEGAKYMKDILNKSKMDDSKAPFDTDEYDYSTRHGRGQRACELEGVLEHDRLLLVLDGDEARHPVFCASVRSFLGVTEDFTLGGCQANLQVSSVHS
jgi:hypothetical protein